MSGHAHVLTPVVDGEAPEYPFTELAGPPEGYTWDDISYVIGGYNWKARFIDNEGFIVTGDADATTQYNLENAELGLGDEWVAYHPGEEVSYDCGACHTTGYSPQGNQDGLPDLIGSWSEPGVQCETCHGPGSAHASHPASNQMRLDRDSAACGECHYLGVPQEVDVSDGFISHHDGYEDLFRGKHATLDCVECHDPHVGVVQLREADADQTTLVECQNCHHQEAENFKLNLHVRDCVTCHMPRIIENAVGDPDVFTGDKRTHAMVINPSQIEQFNAEGTEALPEIGLNFACRQCHNGLLGSEKSDRELIETATGYHEPEPLPISSVVFVENVVVQERDGAYYAAITGTLPDSCSAVDAVEQSVEGNTISLTVSASRPGNILCDQAITPFLEEIQLDTEDLEPGEYTVDVNGEPSTTFTIS
jgi:DNA-directed RNA polymerase subunit M/transcription elongation factor TFIIS